MILFIPNQALRMTVESFPDSGEWQALDLRKARMKA